jgi:hypothetical protein
VEKSARSAPCASQLTRNRGCIGQQFSMRAMA